MHKLSFEGRHWWSGQPIEVSVQEYVLLRDYGPQIAPFLKGDPCQGHAAIGVRAGTRVQLIAGVGGSRTPGECYAVGYTAVCPTASAVATWYIVRTEDLRPISDGF